MAYQLFHKDGASSLFTDSPVVKAAEAVTFGDAVALMSRASDVMAECETKRSEAIRQGRDQGYAEIKEAQASLMTDAITPVVAALAEHHETRQRDLAAMTHGALTEILGEVADEKKMTALTARVLKRIDEDDTEAILLSPDVAEQVKSVLPDSAAKLVQIDPGFQPTQCRIITDSGTVIADLDVQLETLAQRWGLDAVKSEDGNL